MRALAIFFVWQLWERTIRTPWTISMATGMHLRVYPHSTSATEILYCRFGESRDMRFVLSYLKPNDVFVDVGANVGVYSLLAASVDGVRILAFEPDPGARLRLEENVRLNSLETRVHVYECALGSAEGSGFLTVGLDTMNHVVSTSQGGARPVQVARLDTLLALVSSRVAMVKIDVEGLERSVIEGALQVLERDRPALIVEGDSARFDDLLSPLGYNYYDYDPETNTVFTCVDRRGNNTLALVKTVDSAERVGWSDATDEPPDRELSTPEAKPI